VSKRQLLASPRYRTLGLSSQTLDGGVFQKSLREPYLTHAPLNRMEQ
jgi:hypothetical protein